MKTKKIIAGLIVVIVLIFLIWWRYTGNLPTVINYFPNRGVGLFDFVKVEFSRPVAAEKISLEIQPSLKITTKRQVTKNTIWWQISGLPQEKTTYAFKLYYQKKLIKQWRMTPPRGSTGVGIYPPDFEQDLEDYVRRTPLLQSIPSRNPYFRVKYFSETYIAIYLLDEDKDKAVTEAKKWLDSLPSSTRIKLKVDWVR